MSYLTVTRHAGVAWITLSRPEAMNAFNGALLEELLGAVTELGADRTLRLCALTGAGERAFSAGADLRERRGMDLATSRARVDLFGRAFGAVAQLPCLTVAALNGVALGGGLELALCCDLRIALPTAELGLPEVRLGILPGAGGTQRLPRLIGAARAKELILLGRRIPAARALEIGLIHQVVSPGGLAAAVDALAAELAGCGPLGVAQAKQAIDQGLECDLAEGLKLERRGYEITLASQDRLEGLAAFADKRPPRYEGR